MDYGIIRDYVEAEKTSHSFGESLVDYCRQLEEENRKLKIAIDCYDFRSRIPEGLTLNDEEIKMVNTIIETGMNLTEAARRMYCHRNTIVYRSKKIEQRTGLNPTNFRDLQVLWTWGKMLEDGESQ